ncbi:MAG TPA: hypothetical protein VJS44_14735 [Pyrinomonadaceae bacterium]|nr:hypothetical protein [Pyrinomonadaceae bacterium]
MAEERNVGVARAQESGDTDSTKAELQRRMEEARESITQTVTEIKDTVTNQYQAVRDTVSEALDWREQYRKRPVAFSLGALSAGFILGYTVAGTFTGSDDTEEADYADYRETDAFATTGAEPAKLSSSPYAERGLARPAMSAPAPSPMSAGTTGSSASHSYGSGGSEQSASIQALATTGSQDASAASAASEPDKPGLMERFKETRAYDKLQQEVSVLGDRFIEELSSVGRNVVLPALFAKVKDLFGVDLSNKQGGRGQAGTGGAAAGAQGAYSSGGGQTSGGGTGGASGSSGGGMAGSGGGPSYATSENRGY